MKTKITIKDITLTGLLTALMVSVALPSYFLAGILNKSIFQLSDIIFFCLLSTISLKILSVSSLSATILIDLFFGGLIYIPFSIIIKVLIFLTVYIFKNYLKWKIVFIIPIAYLHVFWYVLVAYILFDSSVVMVEFITDIIQYSVTVFGAILICSSIQLKAYLKNKNENIASN
ncbi:ECF transporter S component family protein [Spiroplasma culicicola]|uniref:Uncharacterized protein n=1 Tax=Spiroplasma culicicola AES-1 TaxID=1276246 RepID=W6A7J4_9MOLU|nr:hypothetical protein [Spiroplasma culicicola]AHI52820.1 hypothetical protein SCULI_v1c04790 [Spiroplasma culicicola AES-1]